MDMLEPFSNVAPHLANLLVLVGFVLLLFFGVHRTLIRSGILQPVAASGALSAPRAGVYSSTGESSEALSPRGSSTTLNLTF